MARHRNVRAMDFDEEYEGYYSCYGHSVEDDSCISPRTEAQFLYNRSGKKQQISAFMNLQSSAEEEYSSEDSLAASHNGSSNDGLQNLDPLELAKLQSCIEGMQNVVGDTVPENILYKAATDHGFDLEKALDAVLTKESSSARQTLLKEKLNSETPPQISGIQSDLKNNGDENSSTIGTVDVKTESAVTTLQNEDSEKCVSSPPGVMLNNRKHTGHNALQIYQKERCAEKPLLNLVVIGHVDAGKSTLMGHLLFRLGCVPKKTMHKYEQDSKKIGKASFMYAWVLDETSEERNRGITMDVAQSKFETPHRTVNLLDAPGHKDFIPNMITGASQADVAVLVVDATKGEFETGFEAGGQTREHTMLIRSLGVSQLAVAVNKMDNVNWEKDRYNEIVSKLAVFLKQAGFKESDVQFVPCSGLTGENLAKMAEAPQLKKWYNGPALVEVIDSFKPPDRPVTKPFRMCVNDVFKGMGSGVCVSGRLEAGMIQNGERVLVMPSNEQATVKGITIDNTSSQHGFAGDSVTLQLVGIDLNNVTSGNIVCDISSPVKITSHFEARLVVFNITVPITKGFPVLLHYQTLSEQAVITKLVSQLHRNTGELVRRHPRCLTKHTSAVVEIKVSRPVCLELYKDFKDLGRFMLRSGGSTVAAGVVTEIF